MRKIVLKKRFKKDVEKIKRTGRDMTRLAEVIDLLEQRKPLPPINRDHQLIGNLKDYRECHLGGDCHGEIEVDLCGVILDEIEHRIENGEALPKPTVRATRDLDFAAA